MKFELFESNWDAYQKPIQLYRRESIRFKENWKRPFEMRCGLALKIKVQLSVVPTQSSSRK